MQALIIFIMMVGMAVMPGMQGIGSGQMVGGEHFRGQMVHSMGMMSTIMKDMHQLLKQGQLTPSQQQEIKDMMDQMSQMMREMLTPQPWQVEERQHRQLQEMQRRLKALKKEVQQQKKGEVQPGTKPNLEEHEH